MKTMLRNIVAALVCAALSHSAHAESPKVVATISPLHSLASALMAGTDSTPHMLAGKGDSPHHFHLRPSGAELLEEADIIFWVSENLETALSKPISARARPGASIELLPTLDPGSLIHYDEGDDGHEGHADHDEHDEHDEHDDHAGHDEHDDHADHDDHGHDDDHADEHREDDDHGHGHEHEDEHREDGHDDHAGHNHGGIDTHIWLSPKLAADISRTMASALIRADAENAQTYRRNLSALQVELSDLDMELRGMLSDLPPLRAFVFHDAYGYFQREYGLEIAGTLLGPDAESHGGLSAARIKRLREIAEEEDIRCVFAEPQFNPRTLTPLTRGFEIKTLTLDPLGADIPLGGGAYFQTMRNLAKGFASCAKN